MYDKFTQTCLFRWVRQIFYTRKMRAPINFIWSDVLYRVIWSDRELSWTCTARECHKYGGSLLVVHDQMEYHQIEHLMHRFTIGVLYVGLKHKVNHKLLSIVLWRNGVDVSFGIIRTCHGVNQLSCWIYFRIRQIYIYIYHSSTLRFRRRRYLRSLSLEDNDSFFLLQCRSVPWMLQQSWYWLYFRNSPLPVSKGWVVVAEHIKAERKWTQFRRRHFQVHFLEWKYLNSSQDITEVCS